MPTTADLAQQLASAEQMIDTLQESLADVQRTLDRDQSGWLPLGSMSADLTGFTHDFRVKQASRTLVASIANPLIKRGVELRCAYIWGTGVEISVEDQPDQGQDVNAAVQAFVEDPDNQQTWTDLAAHLGHEQDLNRCGEVWLCLPTDPVTGRVRVRKLPFEQMVEVRCDPEDESTEQLYLRQWVQPGSTQQRKAWYPALGYRPAVRDKAVDGIEVLWDYPVRSVRVNQVKGRGVGDAFAAVPWSDAYKEWLENWAKYMRALVRFAWRMQTRGDKAAQAAAEFARATARAEAGQTAIMDLGTALEPLSVSGASIDADSGRPLAVMVAAALNLPVTTLLGDPGATGARAVAEIVSADSLAVFQIRQELWRSVIRDVIGWVIDAAIIAPAGPLRGTIVRDGDRLTAILPDGDGRTVNVSFPETDSTAALERVKAIQIVDQSEKMPPLDALRLYLDALGVRDADEILDRVTDDDGNWMGPQLPDLNRWMDSGGALT